MLKALSKYAQVEPTNTASNDSLTTGNTVPRWFRGFPVRESANGTANVSSMANRAIGNCLTAATPSNVSSRQRLC